MKRRSLFAGLMAAFAPVATVAAVAPTKSAPNLGASSVDAMIAEARGYQNAMIEDAMKGMSTPAKRTI